jgi:hypothetical protein
MAMPPDYDVVNSHYSYYGLDDELVIIDDDMGCDVDNPDGAYGVSCCAYDENGLYVESPEHFRGVLEHVVPSQGQSMWSA